MDTPNPPAVAKVTFGRFLRASGDWIIANPIGAVLLVAFFSVAVFFYNGVRPYANGTTTAAHWAWDSWNAEGNMEHAKLVPLIFFGLIWYHRDRLAKAPKSTSLSGLWVFLIGVFCYFLSVRTLQPRLALFALPFLVLGATWYLFGKAVARILLFPAVFLLFTINSAVIEQATFRLQFIVTNSVGILSNLIGVKIAAIGTTLSAADGAFNFEIAEGCSGIRSLIAMAMITALYVHLTQRIVWRKIVIFAASLIFATIGNIGRIFTIVLFARFINKDLAAGLYHDWSDLLFFPFALVAMVAFSKMLDARLPQRPRSTPAGPVKNQPTYDY